MLRFSGVSRVLIRLEDVDMMEEDEEDAVEVEHTDDEVGCEGVEGNWKENEEEGCGAFGCFIAPAPNCRGKTKQNNEVRKISGYGPPCLLRGGLV